MCYCSVLYNSILTQKTMLKVSKTPYSKIFRPDLGRGVGLEIAYIRLKIVIEFSTLTFEELRQFSSRLYTEDFRVGNFRNFWHGSYNISLTTTLYHTAQFRVEQFRRCPYFRLLSYLGSFDLRFDKAQENTTFLRHFSLRLVIMVRYTSTKPYLMGEFSVWWISRTRNLPTLLGSRFDQR